MTDSLSEVCTIHNVPFGGGFTMISNKIFENPNLSWQAKGLLSYILSRPPNWHIHTWQLSKIYEGDNPGNSLHSVKKIIKELKDNGYIDYAKVRDKKGRWIHRYDVYPMPYKEFKKIFPEVELPALEIPETVTQPILINTELKNTKLNTSKEDIAPIAKRRSYDISFSFESAFFEGITDKDLSSWKELYPSVDIELELKKMAEWCLANPKKAKSKKRWRQFINSWLRENNEKIINKQAYQSSRIGKEPEKIDQQIENEKLSKYYERNYHAKNYSINVLSKSIELTPVGNGQPFCLNFSDNNFRAYLENQMSKCGFTKKNKE